VNEQATPFPRAHSPRLLDFEAYSTAAIIDHRREHQTADTTFPLMPSTICRLTPPKNDAWIKSAGKDCGS